ncbi:MAG TPA: polynucleotide adenylyltransferase PcnB [Xanthomonadales bacterium]|nr:polynucleotide adenylyltransferase PcnB [Xanthomonadales bacterium]
MPSRSTQPFEARSAPFLWQQSTLVPDPVPQLEIVPRERHSVSRKQISNNALRVLYRLKDAGFDAYLVGGAVRDLLIGGQPKDFDVATNATPEEVKQLFRNCRLIGRRFRLAHVHFGPEIIEVATFRACSDDGSGDRELEGDRLVRDNVYGTIEDDAVRRDFTVNALYYAIEDFSVRDYVGGFADIERRLLRLIGDPESRYREDPVRMLRAVRLSAKLGFEIEPGSAVPIPHLAPLLAEAPPARLFDEALKLFMTGHGEASFLGLERYGALAEFLPSVASALARVGPPARGLILHGLINTDIRVREGRPVTPAFLFAVLLWPAYRCELDTLQRAGYEPAVAQQRAADRVTLQQTHRVALPRRFSQSMEEIWLLQPRFEQRQRKRVFRLLAHPRFRAAYDFLELRAQIEPELAEQAAFWREAQELPSERLAEQLARSDAGVRDDEGGRRKRRRGRRRSGRGGRIAADSGNTGSIGSDSIANGSTGGDSIGSDSSGGE